MGEKGRQKKKGKWGEVPERDCVTRGVTVKNEPFLKESCRVAKERGETAKKDKVVKDSPGSSRKKKGSGGDGGLGLSA